MSQDQKYVAILDERFQRIRKFPVEKAVMTYIRLMEKAISNNDFTVVKKHYPHRFVTSRLNNGKRSKTKELVISMGF